MSFVYDVFPCVHEMTQEFAAPLYGTEYEIEDVQMSSSLQGLSYLAITHDGSLRNNGFEFITNPLPFQDSIQLFNKLHGVLQSRSGKMEHYSERTSIHVHANCRFLTEEEVKNIIMLYALYETFFFMMVDQHRKDNIHCVPLTQTFLPAVYKHPLPTLVKEWHKYTALNIKPLSKLGTIEFRHMQGHGDLALYTSWLSLINNLITTGRHIRINADTLTEENIRAWFLMLFKDTKLVSFEQLVPSVAFNQIIDVKLGVI